jgi:membrane fusion protein (multidrug efflux system)
MSPVQDGARKIEPAKLEPARIETADLKLVPPAQEAPAKPAPAAAPVKAAPAAGSSRKRFVLAGVGLAALAAAAWYGTDYWLTGRFLVSTDDAYVVAEPSAIAAKLSAYVVEVPVAANQQVRAGDLLVQLEEADYVSALAQAQARLDTQRATIARIGTQAGTADAAIEQAQAQVMAAEADAVRAAAAFERAQKLQQSDFASRATLDNAIADRDRSRAQKAAADAALTSAKAARVLVDAQRVEAERVAAELSVTLEKAARDLTSTALRAPFDGVVAAKSVQVGDYATPGKRVLTLVPINNVVVDANFKETQVSRIVPGETVALEVDAYPGRVFTGRVTGLAPGTGSTFSLLPPDNATGNFTKIVQRVPVRIAVEQNPEAVLRPGMSVTARIDTRTAPTN